MTKYSAYQQHEKVKKFRLIALLKWFLFALIISALSPFFEPLKYFMILAIAGYFITKQTYCLGTLRNDITYETPVFPVTGTIKQVEEKDNIYLITIKKTWRDTIDVRYSIDNLSQTSDFEFQLMDFKVKIKSKKFQLLHNKQEKKQGVLFGIIPGNAIVMVQIPKDFLANRTLEILPKQRCYAGITPIG